MPKTLALLAAGGLLTVTPLALGAPQASASENDCRSGSACLWSQANFAGKPTEITGPTSCQPGITSSALNGGSRFTLFLYQTNDCKGAPAPLVPGKRIATFTPSAGSFEVK